MAYDFDSVAEKEGSLGYNGRNGGHATTASDGRSGERREERWGLFLQHGYADGISQFERPKVLRTEMTRSVTGSGLLQLLLAAIRNSIIRVTRASTLSACKTS